MKLFIGNWNVDKAGLPCFDYTGNLPFKAVDKNGEPVKLPQDPWFLLGNYQLTLFTHVCGEYEIFTGQRSWGKMNFREANQGNCRAEITVDEKNYKLSGMDSLAVDSSTCKRKFGCGFAEYSYSVGDLDVIRNFSVKPSEKIDGGSSAFLLTVKIQNNGKNPVDVKYTEAVTANYEEIKFQRMPKEYRRVKYSSHSESRPDFAAVHFNNENPDPLLFPEPDSQSRYEGYPPSLFIKVISENKATTVDIFCDENELSAQTTETITPGQSLTFHLVIGFYFAHEGQSPDEVVDEMEGYSENQNPYADKWLKILPDTSKETDPIFRREMVWNAYILEAMATYSRYYKETKIPQGTIYDYYWGEHASARDNFQHALPCVYYHPELAKNTLRYMMKRTTPYGEIRLIETGNGNADNNSYQTSDQQLYFFLLLSEYLRVTKDYYFLDEELEYYPVKNGGKTSVADHVAACFIYLRDFISVGPHGLVRLLNSDWNDTIYYILKEPYNRVFHSGESHMNSAMVASIFQILVPELKNASQKCQSSDLLEKMVTSMNLYRNQILGAFLKDLGDRKFPRRMYFNSKPYGEENMFLEPMGFTLQIAEIPKERRLAIYDEMKKRLYAGEKLGARQQENPEFEDPSYDKGSRENGGFWWALNGPVIIGMAGLDFAESQKLLKMMTFANYAENFPQYWSSYWSASDNVESSLIPVEGLPDQSDDFYCQPVFCAHPHAWSLYCYYKLKEMEVK